MWKTVLLNQFHDILPGSSIREVYEVTKKEYEQITAQREALAKENGAVYPVQKTADGAIAYVKDLPSKGYRSYTVLKEAMPVETPFVLTDDHHLQFADPPEDPFLCKEQTHRI